MNVLRAGLMVRVSTDEQVLHGDSLQAQEEALVQYAEENNMRVVKIYRDEGFSARKPVLKRPAMLELLEDVKAGKIDVILFTKLDRWFRNIKEYYKIQEVLESNKVYWKAILEDYNTATTDGRFKVNIMLSVNEQEADRTSDRIKFVLNSKVMRKEAIFATVNCPYGYKVVEIDGVRKLVKNDETREIVEYFFNLAVTANIRYASIQTNQKYGLRRDYKSWHGMCHNELYMGVYKGVEDYCEPYLTPSQFQDVSKPKRTKTSKYRVYLFAGLMRCSVCGRQMVAKYAGSKNKDGIYYLGYRCSAKKDGLCQSPTISQGRVEQYVLENIKPELEKFILEHEVTQPKNPKKKTDTTKFKEQLRRVNVAYQMGNMEDDEYIEEAKKLKALIEKAEKEESQDNPVDIEALKEFLNSGFEKIYSSLTEEEKQRLWRSVIDEIILDGKHFAGIKFKA